MDTNEGLIRAVHLATRKLASSGHFDSLLRDVLAICVEAVGAWGGTVYTHDPVEGRLVFRHVLPEEVTSRLPEASIRDDYGVAGKAFQTRETQISEFLPKPASERTSIEEATGVVVSTMITVPLQMESEHPIGVVQLINKRDGAFNANDAAVLDTISAVSTMAYLNSQLLEESARASTLLGMGKVSHDIGNLAAALFANLSYSEIVIPRLRASLEGPSAERAEPYVSGLEEMCGELKLSVDRIVGYSRLVSDLSAGRALRPNFVLEPMGPTVHSGGTFLDTDARKNFVAMRYDIANDAPATYHDPLYVFRIVQNLVGNAIKAVQETIPPDWGVHHDEPYGEVRVSYRFHEGGHVIEVADTGLGMDQETAKRILGGTARSGWERASGSGWGTKIVLELTATHAGEVSIDSEVGVATTFRVRFPHHPEA